ncbi:MAG: hypothetical protein LW806_03255 [Planctomycetaceae bacterium]|nr:hypothetical protein [Planctomycetaceae bacterium]
MRTFTASSAFAFWSGNVRITVSSALDGASRRSMSARTCSNCAAGALTRTELVRTSGVTCTPPEAARLRNCSDTSRATSAAWPLRRTTMSLRRSPPDCG